MVPSSELTVMKLVRDSGEQLSPDHLLGERTLVKSIVFVKRLVGVSDIDMSIPDTLSLNSKIELFHFHTRASNRLNTPKTYAL